MIRMPLDNVGKEILCVLACFPFGGGELMISRTGYTGDLGYELWIDPADAIALWDALFSTGQLYGIQPMGEDSLDMARLEAGFIAPDVEFHGALGREPSLSGSSRATER